MNRRTNKDVVTRQGVGAEDSQEVLDNLLARSLQTNAGKGPVIGRLCGWDDSGAPLVDFPDNPAGVPLPALSTLALAPNAVDRPVVLLFEGNELRRPIVIGVIKSPTLTPVVTVDDREVVLEGKEQIELRCGKAKIVMTSDGKVLVKGTDIVSRSEEPEQGGRGSRSRSIDLLASGWRPSSVHAAPRTSCFPSSRSISRADIFGNGARRAVRPELKVEDLAETSAARSGTRGAAG